MAEFVEPGFSDYDRQYEAAKPAPSAVADVLLAAADILEVDGWAQGRYHTTDGCHCALGAIGLASGLHTLGYEPALVAEAERDGVPVEQYHSDVYGESEVAYHIAYSDVQKFRLFDSADRALRAVAGAPYVPHWNDEPGRQVEEVIDGLRVAAAEALGL